MTTPTQTNRPMVVTTPLGPDTLLLVRLSGTEALSHLFNFRLDLVAQNSKDIAFDKLLGQPITVRLNLPDNKKRYFTGICSRITQGESDNEFTDYQMEVVPKLWLLTKRSQSRIYQHKHVPDILKEALKGFDVEWQLQGTFEPRDYCVQYRETDFNFVSRLMEEEGIYYYFKHSDGVHKMVVANTPDTHADVPAKTQIPYKNYTQATAGTEPLIYDWSKTQTLCSGKFTLWDHCFELPHKHLEAEKTVTETVSVGKASHKVKLGVNDPLEIYDWPGEYAQRFDGVDKGGADQSAQVQKIFQDNKRTVEIRMQQEAAANLSINGASNCGQLTAGHKFTVTTLANEVQTKALKADGSYVLTSVTHSGNQGDYGSGSQPSFEYHNSFTCIPASLPFRPERVTPKPVIPGTQTAVVVGVKGEEIFTDKYGRIKVQFHWDRQGKNDADSSCWIRVATSWAGKQWGVLSIPRVGQEVIVDFQEGDPDTPIVVGSVFNAEQMPAYKLPDEKTKSYIKTNTSLGGVGFNEIRFEDKKDKQQIFVHAERNMDQRVKNDSMEWVLHDRHLIVGSEKDGKKGDQRELVYQDKHLNVKRNQIEKIEGNYQLTVGKGDASDGGNLDIVIAKQKTELIEKDSGLHIKGDHKEKVVGTTSLTVGKDQHTKVGSDSALEAGQAIHIKAGTTLVIEAGTKLSLKVGSNFVDISPEGITISGAMVNIKGSTTVGIVGGMVNINSGGGGGSAGSGSGAKPVAPTDAKPAEPTKPVQADDAKTGHKSAP